MTGNTVGCKDKKKKEVQKLDLDTEKLKATKKNQAGILFKEQEEKRQKEIDDFTDELISREESIGFE